MATKIFISHSTIDRRIADGVVQLMLGAFRIDDVDIICSSVDGHRLKAGTRFSDLKREIEGAVVIVLATANSIRSEWVLAEMGAAWATAKHSIIMCGNGLTREDIRGPFRDTLILNLGDKNSIETLISTLEIELIDVKSKGHQAVNAAVQRYLENYANSSFDTLNDRIMFREDLLREKNGMKWRQILSRSREDVFIFGWSCLNTWKAGDGRLWTDYLNSDRRLRFLSQDPQAFSAMNGLKYRHICNKASEKDVLNDIIEAEKLFSQKASAHPNLEVKKTNCLLSWSGVLIDSGTDRATIQVELYNYGDPYGLGEDHLNKRINIILHNDSPYFAGFANSIELIWEKESLPL